MGSIERDENYVPRTRSELGVTTTEQLHEMFEETPLYTLGRMLVMQLLGFQAYLLFNTMGCPQDPPGTNVRHNFCFRNTEFTLDQTAFLSFFSSIQEEGIQQNYRIRRWVTSV